MSQSVHTSSTGNSCTLAVTCVRKEAVYCLVYSGRLVVHCYMCVEAVYSGRLVVHCYMCVEGSIVLCTVGG